MASKKVPFNLETLKALDGGKLVRDFNTELQALVADMKQRPREKRARTLTLLVTLTPESDDDKGPDAELDTVAVKCEVAGKKPKVAVKPYRMLALHDGRLAFNPAEPSDPKANLLFDEDDPDFK